MGNTSVEPYRTSTGMKNPRKRGARGLTPIGSHIMIPITTQNTSPSPSILGVGDRDKPSTLFTDYSESPIFSTVAKETEEISCASERPSVYVLTLRSRIL